MRGAREILPARRPPAIRTGSGGDFRFGIYPQEAPTRHRRDEILRTCITITDKGNI